MWRGKNQQKIVCLFAQLKQQQQQNIPEDIPKLSQRVVQKKCVILVSITG